MGVRSVGVGRVAIHLREVADRASDVTPAWRRARQYVSDLARQQFDSQGARLGRPWRPLRPPYAAQKARDGHPDRILIRTGALRRSFTGRPMAVERYGHSTASFGSDLKTAVWMQRGTRHGGKRVVPARPILVVTREVRADMKQILVDYVARGRS